MKKLTLRQEQILRFIRDYTRENDFPPSVRDICEGVGLSSPASVHAQLKNLREMGYLKHHAGKTRAISVTANGDKYDQLPMIPILGRVAAGAPVLATEDIEGYVPFDDGGSGFEHFALRVRGFSMKNAGILPEDVIVVRRQMVVNNGDIVVALIEDEATVKTYSIKNGHVWLLPENEDFSPIDGSNAMILGKVVATMRYYQ